MMRPRARRAAASIVALLLATPVPGAAQGASVGGGLVGSWQGWATLVNEWPGHECRYEGGKEDASVRLELSPEDGRLGGSVAIDLPAPPQTGCPPLRKRYAITEVVIGEGIVSLADSGGHEWNLGLQEKGSVLRGMLAWRQGGPEEPLAEGFSFADGSRPLSRLGGEVQLARISPAGEASGGPPAEGAGPAASATSTSVGRHLGNFGAVLGATAVGLGLLYGANRLGKGSSDQGVVTCSPRRCVVGVPSEPCFCEGNVVSGDSCGTTPSGGPLGAVCDYPSMPCEATLSCNSGVCEDRFGRCPY
jgi:hypothetical protein